MTAHLTLALKVLTDDGTAETVTSADVADVRDMRGSPAIVAALLRRAADDLDPPQRPMRLMHEGVPGARSLSPDLQRGLPETVVTPATESGSGVGG